MTPEISHTGLAVGIDRASEAVLEYLAKMYMAASINTLKVADLGCGSGHLACLMPYVSNGTKPMTIFGVDGVAPHVASCKERKEYIEQYTGPVANVTHHFMHGMLQDLETLPPFARDQDGTFDMVTCQNVLHLMSPDEKISVLRKFYSLLKPGGVLIFSHNRMNATTELPGVDYRTLEDGVYCYPYTLKPDGDAIELSNFKITRMQDFGDVSPQEYLVFGEDESQVSKDSIKRLNYSETAALLTSKTEPTLFYLVTERVSEESLRQKCIEAGVDMTVSKVRKYAFDEPRQTTFVRVLHPGLNFITVDENNFLVTVRKPILAAPVVTISQLLAEFTPESWNTELD